MSKLLKRISIFFLLFTSPCLSADVSQKALMFGVVPQQSALKLAQLWVPIIQQIRKATGLNIHFKTAASIPAFERNLAQGKYDLAYMNPYHYVVFHKKSGYQAFAKQTNKQIKGIIVVHKDSLINDLNQLNGDTLVFPSPAAFAASILARQYLIKNGIDFKTKYVLSHDSVYLNVAKKLYPAGGGIFRTLNNTDQKIFDQLKVLWVSDPYTPHAFAAHPNLDARVIKDIQQSLVDMNKSTEGRKILSAIRFEGIEAAIDKDWHMVERLNLEQLNDYQINLAVYTQDQANNE